MTEYWPILIPLFTYLIGSVPFGSMIGRLTASVDITQLGSGNTGATNVAREIGIKWGLLTLFLDMIKGFLPVYIYISLYDPPKPWLSIAIPVSLLLGHRFSPFLKFRGGKGVATALGIFLALSPVKVFILFPVFALIVYVTGYVSLGSMTAACMMPLILFFTGSDKDMLITAVCLAGIICVFHKDNITRLIKGEERSLKKIKSRKNIQ